MLTGRTWQHPGLQQCKNDNCWIPRPGVSSFAPLPWEKATGSNGSPQLCSCVWKVAELRRPMSPLLGPILLSLRPIPHLPYLSRKVLVLDEHQPAFYPVLRPSAGPVLKLCPPAVPQTSFIAHSQHLEPAVRVYHQSQSPQDQALNDLFRYLKSLYSIFPHLPEEAHSIGVGWGGASSPIPRLYGELGSALAI